MNTNRRFSFPDSQPIQTAIYFLFSALLLLTGCARDSAVQIEPSPQQILAPMGYTIQVGAFSNMNNAVRLTEKLHQQGLVAYHFLHSSGLYKVRFGNYMSQQDASWRAESLKLNGIITEYYIVGPDEYAAVKDRRYGPSSIRDHLVKTAKRYIGVPYKWGGESAVTGFDCSGYTMVIYHQNGLNLPRSSRQQWKAGKPITHSQLLKGDLVFFATSGGKKVSHVGIYLGGNKFLHSPGKGRKIQTASLADSYFKSRYLGARTYL
ncbi:MAG: NlpC/P60 family protein [Desulfobacterales bacterium]|jgi:cell wall-associated NlpC family hydrolase